MSDRLHTALAEDVDYTRAAIAGVLALANRVDYPMQAQASPLLKGVGALRARRGRRGAECRALPGPTSSAAGAATRFGFTLCRSAGLEPTIG